MGPYGGEETLRTPVGSGARRGSDDEGVIGTASLEVHCCAAAPGPANGPAMYEVVYTRGGWIWRTTHRYSEWLALKERLRTDFGARNLPHDRIFPQKEDVGAIVTKLLTSCQGCREGGGRPVGILEDRRRGLQTYFSLVLEEQRELWDTSPDIKSFFFPGPPTSYSAALSKRRSERLKEEKQKAKEAASAASMMASSLKSTLGSLFESSPPTSTSTTPSKSSSSSFSTANTFPTFVRTASAVSSSSAASPRRRSEDQGSALEPASVVGATVAPPPPPSQRPRSMMNRLSAMKEQMPSLRDLLFDDAPPATGSVSGGSRASSRHGAGGSTAQGGSSYAPGGSRHNKPLSSSVNKPPSESGVTDPDGGMSEMGGSKHSSIICE